jgi:hypothetical protein
MVTEKNIFSLEIVQNLSIPNNTILPRMVDLYEFDYNKMLKNLFKQCITQ